MKVLRHYIYNVSTDDQYQNSLNFYYHKEFVTHKASLNLWEGKPDSEVWNSFKNGDDQAFNFLYKKYVQQLFQYGCELTTDREFVKDRIQDLFIYLRRKRSKLGDAPSIKAYLFKSLRRDIFRNLRKEQKGASRSLEYNQKFQISLSHETKLINEQLIKEKKEHIERALSKLSARQREAIILFYYENLSYKEIAEVLEMKMVKSARKLIYRGIDTLKCEILPYKSSLTDPVTLLLAVLSFLF